MKLARLAAVLAMVATITFMDASPAAAHGNYSHNLCSATGHNWSADGRGRAYTIDYGEECVWVGARVQTYYQGSIGWGDWCYSQGIGCEVSRLGSLQQSAHYLEGTGALYPPGRVFYCGRYDCGNPVLATADAMQPGDIPVGARKG